MLTAGSIALASATPPIRSPEIVTTRSRFSLPDAVSISTEFAGRTG